MSRRSAAPFPGLHSPAAGFDQPFEMLSACHERVRRSLALLQRLVAHVDEHGADRQARDAAADVLRYFNQAAPAHHEDEERHVIPRLQASDDPRAQAAARQLLEDHAAIRQRWAALAPLLQSLADGVQPGQALHAAAQAFADVHEAHLQLEDGFAFPSTERQLQAQGDEALRAMGEEMAARRRAPRQPAGALLARPTVMQPGDPPMDDKSILQHITELVDEEQRLRGDTARPEQHAERLKHLEEQLDQCWDLLRQRRAKREFGDDPDSAKPRDVGTVERYLN